MPKVVPWPRFPSIFGLFSGRPDPRSELFSKKSIPYGLSGQSAGLKVLLYWSSTHQLFTKIWRFHWFLSIRFNFFSKYNFFILSRFRLVSTWSGVLTLFCPRHMCQHMCWQMCWHMCQHMCWHMCWHICQHMCWLMCLAQCTGTCLLLQNSMNMWNSKNPRGRGATLILPEL